MKERLDRIEQILDNKKAENIQQIDLEGKEYITDAVVVATSLNARHGESLLNELKTQLKAVGEEFVAVEDSGDWVVIDLGDIIIHILTKEYREKYTIESFLDDIKSGKYFDA